MSSERVMFMKGQLLRLSLGRQIWDGAIKAMHSFRP